MDCGEQCAVMDGQQGMQMWLVDNLDILVLVCKNCNIFILTINIFFLFIYFLFSYKRPDATAYSSANFGQGTVPILLDDVACTVYESRLIDCPYSSHTSDCTHSLDAGVRCVARKLHSYTGTLLQ